MKFIYNFVKPGGFQVAAYHNQELYDLTFVEADSYTAKVIITNIGWVGNAETDIVEVNFAWYNSNGVRKAQNTLYKMAALKAKEIILNH